MMIARILTTIEILDIFEYYFEWNGTFNNSHLNDFSLRCALFCIYDNFLNVELEIIAWETPAPRKTDQWENSRKMAALLKFDFCTPQKSTKIKGILEILLLLKTPKERPKISSNYKLTIPNFSIPKRHKKLIEDFS